MFTVSEWDRLGGLLFVARRLVEGMWPGRHAAVRQGSGLEFHEYRSYTPGDSPADVDWKLFGRTNRYYVRRHRQATDLHAYLMLDCSASMDFAGLDRRGRPMRGDDALTKLHYGAQLAAAVAFLAIRQSDRAGVGLCGEQLLDHLAPAGAWSHLMKLCRTLEQVKASEQPGDLGRCLRQAHALMPRRGLIILISDLLDDPAPILDGLTRFRHDHFEVVVFHTLTRSETDLSDVHADALLMRDAESPMRLRTDPQQAAAEYRRRMQDHLASIQRGCQALGVDYQLLYTDQPVHIALRRYLSHRQAALR